MSQHPFTIPDLYDLLHCGTPGDTSFYRSRCDGKQTILELACGTGRHLVSLSDVTDHVYGLELSVEMLARAQQILDQQPHTIQEKITLLQGDMRSFAIEAPCDAILIPYNSLYCLLTEEEVLQCFHHANKQLRDGGELLFDVYAVDPAWESFEQTEPELVAVIEENGYQVEIYEDRHWLPTEQRLDATYRHIIHDGQHSWSSEYTIPQRYLFREQIEQMLDATGFQVRSCWGDFDDPTWDHESPHMIINAKKLRRRP